MSSSSSASQRTVLRQDLWQEPYAVVLQVRICAGASGNWRPCRDLPVDVAARIVHGALMGGMTRLRSSGRYSAEQFRNMSVALVQA